MSNSKGRVLLICYYFPPLGGAGIGRTLSLFKELGDFGYDCHVLTVKPVVYRMYEHELLKQLDSARIFRSGSIDPQRLLYLFGFRKVSTRYADDSRLISKSFFPDSKVGWVKPAIRRGQKLIGKNSYDLILSSSPPVSAHLVAKELSERNKISWIADWRDYWTSFKPEDLYNDQSDVNKRKELVSDLNSAARIVTSVNSASAKYVGAEKIIPNSFDKDDARLWSALDKKDKNDKFLIGLFGTLSDLTPVRPLFDLLNQMREQLPNLFEKVSLLQIGQVDSDWLDKQIREYGLVGKIEKRGYLPRRQAIAELNSASLFYLGVSRVHGQGITTGRIYTLLASGRPILAYAREDSELAGLLREVPGSFVFDTGNISSALQFVKQSIEMYGSKENKISPMPEHARNCSSSNMVRQFAKLFDEVLGK